MSAPSAASSLQPSVGDGVKAGLGWPAYWDQPTCPDNPERILELLRACQRRRAEMIRVLRRVKTQKGHRAAKRLSRRYLRSFSARLARMARAMMRRKVALDGTDPQALHDLVKLTSQVDPWRRQPDRAVAIPREKMNGERRWVYRLSLIPYANDQLAHDVLQALADLEPTQFITQGSRPALEEWLEAELPHFQLVLTTDIPACFDSVLRYATEPSLPLPRKVQHEVLHGTKDRALFMDRGLRGPMLLSPAAVAKVTSLERGYAQGAASAAVASEIAIGGLLRAVHSVSSGVRGASMGDNLIVGLRDASDLGSARHALLSSAGKFFGQDVIGELTRRTRVQKIDQWISFCGRDYRVTAGKLRSRVDPHRAGKFGLRLMPDFERAIRTGSEADVQRIVRRAMGYALQNLEHPAAVQEAMETLIHAARLFGNPKKAISDEPPLVEVIPD